MRVDEASTVKIQNMGTVRSEQTVQTQITLLLKQSDQGLLSLLLSASFWRITALKNQVVHYLGLKR